MKASPHSLSPSAPPPTHTHTHPSLIKGQCKATTFHLLRESSLAWSPFESYPKVKVKPPCNYQYPGMLFTESSLAPSTDTPKAGTANTPCSEPAAWIHRVLTLLILTAVHAHTQQYSITCTHNCRAHAHRSPTACTGALPQEIVSSAFLGSDDQVHNSVLPTVADAPDIFSRVSTPVSCCHGPLLNCSPHFEKHLSGTVLWRQTRRGIQRCEKDQLQLLSFP